MLACDTQDAWTEFLVFAKERCSSTAFNNWLTPIRFVEGTTEEVVLEVPNIFVQDYLLTHYLKDLCGFLPVKADEQPAIRFIITKRDKEPIAKTATTDKQSSEKNQQDSNKDQLKLDSQLFAFA